MSLTDDLYREIILDHFKSPRNHGVIANPSVKAEGANPFCGDELQITVLLKGNQIADIKAQSKGCSISQASASMMTEIIKGKTLEETQALIKTFKAVMLEDAPIEILPPGSDDLESLEGVKKYPVRIKCAILSWNTLLDGLDAYHRGQKQVSHVEGEEGDRPELAKTAALETSAAGSPAPASAAGDSNQPQEQVRNALKTVIDPELNMNVVDLGLIYGVEVQGNNVKVTYTLTSPGCPLGPVIRGQMQGALGKLPWVKEIQPELVWTPPWDPHTMASEEAKAELGIW